MEKTVTYPRAKFSVEAIKEAEAVLGRDDTLTLEILRVSPTEEQGWSFDDSDEFFAQYRLPHLSAYYYQLSEDGKAISVNSDRWSTLVTVRAPTRGIIEATFAVFEKHREASTTPELIDPIPLPPPPHIFIGHGRADDWRDLKDHLHEQHHYRVEAYETGARTGHAIRDVLDDMMNSATFAIVVLTAEDEMADGQLRPRENVVHETGLFQGRLGWRRAIMLVENGVEPFSNVAGITQIRFDKHQIRSTFGDVVATLRAEFGPGPFQL